MLRAVPAILSIALAVYALTDCVQAKDDKVPGIPKWAWIILIVLVPWIGPITWLLVSRMNASGERGGSPSRGPHRNRPLAPDEDPEFLRKLDEDIRRERRERERRQQESDAPPPEDPDDPEGPEEPTER